MDNQTPPTTNPTENPNTAQTPPSSPKSFLSKKAIFITLFILIILAIVFAIPFPRYIGKTLCSPCQDINNCPPCPYQQWIFEKPLFWSIILPLLKGTPVNKTVQVNTSQLTPSPIPTIDETTNWKTYKDKLSRFTFKYPDNFSMEEEIAGNNNVYYATLTNDKEKFRFEIGPKDYVGLFEHFKTDQIESFNNISWIFVKSGEFCDAGNCGTTSSGYYLYKDLYYVGVLEIKKDSSRQTLKQILSTFKITETNQENVLKIPEYGVQIALSDEIKDAYYINTTASKRYVYLKVHSLDTEPQCKKDDSSTASLSRVGKDEINPMTDGKYSDSFKGKIIGNYFYYIDLAQYSCAETTEGKAKLEKARSAFTTAEITQ